MAYSIQGSAAAGSATAYSGSVGNDVTFADDGQITHLRFYRSAAETGDPHTMRVWSSAGAQLASVSIAGTGAGWKIGALSSPLVVAAGTTVRISLDVVGSAARGLTYTAEGDLTLGPGFLGSTGQRPTGSQSANTWGVDLMFDAGIPAAASGPPTTGQIWPRSTGSGGAAGATDHGALTGLTDDDHPQYTKKAGDTMTGNLVAGPSQGVQVGAVWDGTTYRGVQMLPVSGALGAGSALMLGAPSTADPHTYLVSNGDINLRPKFDGSKQITITQASATFAQPVVLPADPVGGMEAATKQYVDNKVAGVAGGGIQRVVSKISVATTAAAAAKTDYVYICSAALTLTLPTAVGNTNRYTVKRMASAANINVTTTASQTIDGAAPPFQLDVQWMAIDLISDGANWMVI